MKTRRFLLSLVAVLALASSATALAGSAINCQGVGQTAVTVLSARAARLSYSIWTTSGAATIYFAENGNTAVVPAGAATSTSAPLTGGLTYTVDRSMGQVVSAVSAVSKTGTNWICTKEGF